MSVINPYANTVIYKIVCNDLNVKKGYIGHTTDFKARKQQHKSQCNLIVGKKYNYNLYKEIRANEGWDNYSMLIVESYPCNDSNEAREREQEYYKKLDSSLNTRNPYNTFDEKSIERERERGKIKYEKNKAKLSEVAHQKFTCECGVIRSISSRTRHLKSPIHTDLLNKKQNEKL
jgi:hypothetical protein